MVKSEDGAEVWVDGGGGREEKARTQEERTVDGRSAYRDGRKKTLSVNRLSKKELVRGSYVVHLALAEGIPGRPLHRRECESGGRNAERPCPYVSCKHHLFLDVNQRSGSITMNFPDLELHELDETCALDVARENPSGVSLDKVAARMNLTRERVRQVETRAALRLRDSPDIQHLRDYLDTRDEGGGYDQTMPQERSAEGRTETRLSFPEIEERGREALQAQVRVLYSRSPEEGRDEVDPRVAAVGGKRQDAAQQGLQSIFLPRDRKITEDLSGKAELPPREIYSRRAASEVHETLVDGGLGKLAEQVRRDGVEEEDGDGFDPERVY